MFPRRPSSGQILAPTLMSLPPLAAVLCYVAVVFLGCYFPGSDNMTTPLLDSSTCSTSISKFCCFNSAEWSATFGTPFRLMSLCILSLWDISESLMLTGNRSPIISLCLAQKWHFTANAWSWLIKDSIVSSKPAYTEEIWPFSKHLGIKYFSAFPNRTLYHNHKVLFSFLKGKQFKFMFGLRLVNINHITAWVFRGPCDCSEWDSFLYLATHENGEKQMGVDMEVHC